MAVPRKSVEGYTGPYCADAVQNGEFICVRKINVSRAHLAIG